MPSHMSSIGFPVSSEDDFLRYQTLAADNGQPLPAPHGFYVRWQAGQGAELWVQVTSENSIVGLNPHFGGEATLRVSLQGRLLWPNEGGLDGAYSAVSAAGTADSQAEPFVFDAPDFALHSGLALPAEAEVQLAGFAEDLYAYPSDDAFAAAQPGGSALPPEAFLPSDPGEEDDAAAEPPEAYATLAGHVLRTELRTNPATGEQFWWALLRTQGLAIEIVADPAVVKGRLAVGGVAAGSFWLSGRIVS
jgi:hypothetical protein